MILGFRHKGLRLLHEEGSVKGVEAVYARKLRNILAALEMATTPENLALPGFKLHPLTGDRKGFWSITVGANWRIVFRFSGMDVDDVNLIDYH